MGGKLFTKQENKIEVQWSGVEANIYKCRGPARNSNFSNLVYVLQCGFVGNSRGEIRSIEPRLYR